MRQPGRTDSPGSEVRRPPDDSWRVGTAFDSARPIRRFRAVLCVLVALCLALAALVWWQLLRELP